MLATLLIAALLTAEPPRDAAASANIVKLLQSPKEADRMRGAELAKELPSDTAAHMKKPLAALCAVAKDDPSHACRQVAITALGKVGNDSCVDALQQIGSKHCLCEKLAFKSLMQLGTTKAREAAEKLCKGCDNETLKEEMAIALGLKQVASNDQPRPKRSEKFKK